MLESRGLSVAAEAVYRVLLVHHSWGIDQIAAHLMFTKQQVKTAQQQLVDLALVTERESQWVAVAPAVGLSALLARAEAEVIARRQQIEATRTAVMAMTAQQGSSAGASVRRIEGLDAIITRMTELGTLARREVLLLVPDQGPTADLVAEVTVRHLVQTSVRFDTIQLARVRDYAEAGHEVRTIPSVPMPMAVYDRATVLVPIDPDSAEAGMLEVTNSGVVAVACALFDELWSDSTPLDHQVGQLDGQLDPVQRQLLRMLAEGHTDELAARRLGVSLSTVRRTVAALMGRLEARSRFQAGIRTVERGWLGAASPVED
ncbi:helix-turn-helix transcriptional regulator [Actinoplanes sp. NPDC026623]|uniref:helix-turn-helix transcriptional regulator n=1 Tax=Actinoplanes sp. NPDC026623 TaxID=3155610 RepID=UPI0033CE05D5